MENINRTQNGGAPTRRLLRISEVVSRTGLPEASVYDAIRAGAFPRPVKIGARSSAWPEHEVQQWIDERIAARDGAAGVAA